MADLTIVVIVTVDNISVYRVSQYGLDLTIVVIITERNISVYRVGQDGRLDK